MRLIIFSFSLCVIFSTKAFTQIPKIKFGKISIGEFSMKVYPKDSSAEAVVLYEYGETSFEERKLVKDSINKKYITYLPNAIYRKHRRIRIFEECTFEEEFVQVYPCNICEPIIKGFAYRLENGKIIKEKLTIETAFKKNPTDKYATTVITFLNVHAGSIIEYFIELNSNFVASVWNFQQNIPKVWSEYHFKVPFDLVFQTFSSGYLPFALHKHTNIPIKRIIENDFSGIDYCYAMQDIPAFHPLPFITTPEDYISKIYFETWKDSTDYPTLNQTLSESLTFGQALKKTGFLKDIAKSIRTKMADSTALMQAAVDSVRKNIKWDGYYRYNCDGMKRAFDKQTGSSGDINLILVGLLRELGFAANPVILSTRNNGRIDQSIALKERFNNVVAEIDKDGKAFFLDATDKYLPIGMLPEQCLNKLGWMVTEGDGRMVSLAPNFKELTYENATLKIGEDGELQGSIFQSFGEYQALKGRTNFKKDGKEKYIENIKKTRSSWTINKVEFNNTEVNNLAFEATYDLSINDFVTKAGNLLYLNPMISEGKTENPFKQPNRIYPIDFGKPIEETFMATYDIPQGYSVLELPKNLTVMLPDNGGKFSYIISQNAEKISVMSRIQLRKPLYISEEYPALKGFYDKIVAKHNEQIVLKKK